MKGRWATDSKSQPLIMKKHGRRKRIKTALYPIFESPKQKWQTCANTTRIIVNPRIASIYSIRCRAISIAKLQKKSEFVWLFWRIPYFCIMKERINWIDWAKALAVCSVVFCHLPQSQEWFYYRYLQALTMVIFFFISGYLKKDRGSDKENWKKYLHGLVIPYILYNIIVYP